MNRTQITQYVDYCRDAGIDPGTPQLIETLEEIADDRAVNPKFAGRQVIGQLENFLADTFELSDAVFVTDVDLDRACAIEQAYDMLEQVLGGLEYNPDFNENKDYALQKRLMEKDIWLIKEKLTKERTRSKDRERRKQRRLDIRFQYSTDKLAHELYTKWAEYGTTADEHFDIQAKQAVTNILTQSPDILFDILELSGEILARYARGRPRPRRKYAKLSQIERMHTYARAGIEFPENFGLVGGYTAEIADNNHELAADSHVRYLDRVGRSSDVKEINKIREDIEGAISHGFVDVDDFSI